MRDAEPPETSATPPDAIDDEREEQPRVSSLRPTPAGFSQRRLLNIASIGLAAIVVLALAIRWLPDALSRQPNVQATRTIQTFNAQLPLARGSGWKSIGSDSAEDITFTSNGALGYVCGVNPLGAAISLSVYDVHQNTWNMLPTPATGDSCRVYIPPDAGNFVLLAVDHCLTVGNCSDSYPASRLYDSYDSGETWEELHLPAVMNIYDIVWANFQWYLAVRSNLSADSATIPPNTPSHLLVSQRYRLDGTFEEVDAQHLVGSSMRFSDISLVSSGTTLYASLNGMSCASYCTIHVRSADNGAHWTPYSASYKGSPITPQSALPFTHTLVGWAFLPTPGVLVPLRSDDDGDSWRELPAFHANPSTSGAVLFAAPDNTVFAFCYGDAGEVYALPAGANTWRLIAPLPAGTPVTVQYDADGHAVALWGRAINPTAATGLEYFPLQGSR